MRALLSAALLLITVSAAQAQAPAAGDANLPASPGLQEAGRPSDFLRAAQGALVAGRLGEAQETLEMAQTRMLDRSVPLGQTNSPSENPTVGQIAQARQALAARDRGSCLRFIQAAIESAVAQGL